MAYQIYRTGEWERVSGVDGYSTIRAYLQPELYETEAYASKKAARLAHQDYENGGERMHAKRRDVDTRSRPSSAKSPRIAASNRTKPA